ncbi:hypothetical protein PR003_g30053 [Phytophthora rubi]|uniref:Uncharacterized protein n=1 Tax=Phytophthora rubi TaxID=129364 RepID=A0A6A4BK20_9STRA|nr:hypothetical protein PR003_g30053 [Phytophthora rubi]
MIAWSDPKSALTCLVNPTNPAGDKYGRGADKELHRDHVPRRPYHHRQQDHAAVGGSAVAPGLDYQ